MSAAMNELMVELGAMRQRFEDIKKQRDDFKAELSTWKTRAEDLQKCIDARARVMEASNAHWKTATSKIKHLWENGFFPGIEGLCDKLLETIAEHDTLKARCDRIIEAQSPVREVGGIYRT